MIPLRRLGRPVDIAAAVLFLVSLDGEWINGQTIRVTAASSNPWSFLQPSHPMIQTMHKFFACREGMRPEDPKDRNPRNFDNGSNFNWRAIVLFVVFTSVVLALFLFSRNGNYRSVDGPGPRLSYDERNRGPAPIPPSERSLQTIVARPGFKVLNGGLQLEGSAFDREGHLLFLEIYGGSSRSYLRRKKYRFSGRRNRAGRARHSQRRADFS